MSDLAKSIAQAWLEYQGYTPDIAARLVDAEIVHDSESCEFLGSPYGWRCEDEYGNDPHEGLHQLRVDAELIMFTIERMTPRRQRKPITHGTTAGYRRRCRCMPCRAAMSDYMRAHREANPEYYARINERLREGRPARPRAKQTTKVEVTLMATRTAFTDRQLEIAADVLNRKARA